MCAPVWAQNVPQAPAAQAPAMQRPAPTPAQASGNLARFLVGPGGRVRGLVLDNGTVVMVPPRASADLAQRVRVGQPLRVEGVTFPGATAGTATIFRATVRGADGSVIAAPPAPRPVGAERRRGRAGRTDDGPRRLRSSRWFRPRRRLRSRWWLRSRRWRLRPRRWRLR
ncbi:MAG: hypothetical protein U0326_24695 [Polyangiales bacterium]